MKCPECKKEIEIPKSKDSTAIFLGNAVLPMMVVGVIGSSFKFSEIVTKAIIILMFAIGLFYMIYSLLYVAGRVKGSLLIYKE